MKELDIFVPGGRFHGCAFGAPHSLSSYFDAVDRSNDLADDIKDALKRARGIVEGLELPNSMKTDVVNLLARVTDELEQARPDAYRVSAISEWIKDAAPPVAAALSSASNIALMLARKAD